MSVVRDVLVGRIVAGDPIEVGDVTIVPQARVRTLMFPFGGLVNSHPDAVLVAWDGKTRRVPVVNETRRIRRGLLTGLLMLWVAVIISSRRRRSDGSRRK